MSDYSNKLIRFDLSVSGVYQQYFESSDVVIWLEEGFEDSWFQNEAQVRTGRRDTYSQACIELILTLKSLLGFSLRNIIELWNQAFRMLDIQLPVPDHSQLSRRSKTITDLPIVDNDNKVVCHLGKNGFECQKQEQIENTEVDIKLVVYFMVFTKSKRVCKSFISNQVFNEYPKKLKGDRRRIIFILYKNREEEATEKVISRKGSNQKKPAE